MNPIVQKLKKTLSSYSSLLLLFQRSPLVQMLFPEANFLASSAALNSTNLAIATVVGLGAYDSVAGATTLVQASPTAGSSIVTVPSGVAFTGVFQVTSPSPPESWAVSSGTLPAGLTLANNPGVTTTLTGTTTELGDKVVTIKAWEFAGFTGPSISKVFTIRVAVHTPAGITTHPSSKTISSGTSTSLSVVASGTAPLTYQWYRGASGVTTTPVGTNSASFTTPTLTSTTNYWVKVTNLANLAGAFSNTATVTIGVPMPAAITTHPASTTINSGQTTSLSVVATGDAPLTYQWYQGASGTTTTPVGTNASSFTTPTLAATTSYWVKVTNAANLTGALSNTAVVTVLQPAAITTHPVSTTINSGQTTSLSVVATGDAPFTYQWYQGSSGTTTTPVGTNAASFTTPTLTATTSYWVKVTNAANLTGALSNTATVTVLQPAAITTHPASTTINSGQSTTLSVVATGDAPFTYQWYEGASGTTTTPVGTNAASFTTPTLTVTTSYWVKVTNAANLTGALSNTAVVTVLQPAAITTHPASTTINSGQSTTLSVVASGDAPFTYQWYQGASGTTTTPVGTNAASFTTPTLTATTSYWVKVTNAANLTGALSNTATVTVLQPAAITTHPASTTINSGQSTTLSVVASGDAPFTYQWYQGASGTTTTPVGTNAAAFTTPALTTTTSYWVKVTNAANLTGALSNTATVTVLQPAAITTHPASITINSGQSTTLSVAASGDAPFTYQWYQGASGTTTTPVGTNAASFTTPTLTATTNYWVKVTNAANLTGANSNTAVVTVLQPAAITTHPASTTINSGQTTTLSVVASGDAPFTYQWYQGASGTTTTPVGTNAASFTTPTLTATTNYWVKVTNAANLTGANSNTATVTVLQPAAITTHPLSTSINSGQTTTLSVVATGDAPLVYQWYQGTSGVTTTPVGTNAASFTTPALTVTTQYWVKVTNIANAAGADSNTATVTVQNPAAITTHPASTIINSGQSTTLSVVATGEAPLTYQWYQGSSGVTTTPVGTNAASFATPTLTATTSYWVKVTNLVNPTGALSTTATVTVLPVSPPSAYVMSQNAGLVAPSSRGIIGTTWFGWETFNEPAARAQSIDDSTPDIGTTTVGANFQTTNGQDHVLANGNLSFTNGTLAEQITVPTSGTVGSNGFTTLVLQIAAVSGSGDFVAPITLSSINGVTPTVVQGLNSGGDGQLWAKWDLPGNQASYLISISGAPGQANFSFDRVVVDSLYSTEGYLADSMAAVPPSITTASPLPVSVVAVAFNQQLAGAGGTAPYQFTLNAGTLPAGLTLSTSGLLSGTPSATAASHFTILITDVNGLTAAKAFDLTITTAPSITTASPLPVSVVNVALSQQLAGTGGTVPYQFTVSAGTLPAGLALSTGGLLSGTPTATSASSFTVLITDANGLTASKAFDLTITTAPSITTVSPLPVSVVAVPFNQQFAGAGGTTPYQFTVSTGTLPAGLTLSTSGLLSGTPTATVNSHFTVLITDANGLTATKAFDLTITTAPSITTASPLPVSVVNVALSQQLAGTGGTAPYQFTVSAGALPAGLTLSTSGLLSGTPTATIASSFTVLITDVNGLTAAKAFDLTITTAPVITTASPLPVSVVNVALSQQLAGTGGTAPYQFTVSTGTLPAGLTLSTGGLLSGTPSATTASHFTVLITDANGLTANKAFDLSITTAPVITTASPLPVSVVNVVFNQQLAGTGGTAPYQFTVSAGTVPDGLSLSTSGLLSGTPSATAISHFTVLITDANGLTATKAFDLTITTAPSITTASPLPVSVVNVVFNQQLAGTGGTAPYQFTVSAGTLPAGLTLSTGGLLSGTPSTTTASHFTVLITDANSLTANKAFDLTITTAPSITTASPLLVSVVNVVFNQQLAGTGGTAPYQFTVSAGTLPAGLTLSTGGLLSGTPSATGTSNFTVLITDANGLTATKTFDLNITTAPSITTASPLPVSVVDVAFNQQLAGTGGTAPYQFTVSTGTLPAGLTLSTGGLLSGTPTATGASNFTVLITDANGLTATKAFDLSITTTPVISTLSPLVTGLTNTAYSVNLAASGGTTPYTWSLSSGTLPVGLSLSSTGVLSGTPTAPGTSNFIVQVQDDNGFTDTETYSVTMSDLVIATTSLPTAVKAVAFTHSLIGTGTSMPFTWAVTAGTLPAGITLSSGGVFSGTPTTAGSSIITVSLTDSTGFAVTKELTLTVSATFLAPVIQPIYFPTAIIGTNFSYTVSAQNYPKTYAITGLPKGLTAVAATGVISGIPTVSGVFNVQVRATNTGGTSPTVAARLIVKALNKNLIGTFGGLVTRDPVNRGLGGTLTVTTTSLGSYTIKLITASGSGHAATLYSITTGHLAATAPQISVLIGGQTLALTFNATTGQITGTHGSATVSGIRSVWNAAANPAENLAGYYSMALNLTDAPDKASASIPHGSGFATFSVSLAGSLTAVVKTADGDGNTSASFLGANGEFWAYAPLYKNAGSIQGELNLSQDAAGLFAGNVVSGSMTWFKPATTGPTYPASFGPTNVTVEGGYLAPASAGSVVLGLPDAGSAQLSFTSGGLAASVTNPNMSFTYTSDNKVALPLPAANPGKVALTINANTGVVGGNFALAEATPPTRSKVTFQGQVVRMIDGSVKAVGYFMLPQILTGGLTAATLPSLSGGFSIQSSVLVPANTPSSDGTGLIGTTGVGLSITTATLPTAVKAVAFNHSLTNLGGTAPYTWTVSAGTLPAGITLSTAGVLSGTPTAAGSSTFTVNLADSGGDHVTNELTLTVSATYLVPILQPIHFPTLIIGTAFSQTVSAQNYPKTFAITGLPKGLTAVAATGVIKGIPAVSGIYNVQVRATNPGGTSATLTVPLVVKALNKNLVGTFGGLVSRDPVNRGLGGTLTVTTTSIGSYSIKLISASGVGTAATLYPASGFLAASAPQISVLIGGQTLALTFNATTGQITGTHGSATVSGIRSAWNALANPAEKLAGYYSMALDLADVPDQGVASIPQGTGFATFSVSLAGSLTAVGKTADGEAITSASFLGANGDFWAYTPLYKNLGSIQGLLNLSEDVQGLFENNLISGSMSWFKPTTIARAYAATFGPINLKAEGGYLAPASTGSVVLGLPDAGSVRLNFTDGGLAGSITDPDMSFTYSSDNKVVLPVATVDNPGKVALTINATNGVVGGNFTLMETAPPLPRAKVPFQGQVVRMLDGTVKAAGYFMLPQIPSGAQTAATAPILSGGFNLQQSAR